MNLQRPALLAAAVLAVTGCARPAAVPPPVPTPTGTAAAIAADEAATIQAALADAVPGAGGPVTAVLGLPNLLPGVCALPAAAAGSSVRSYRDGVTVVQRWRVDLANPAAAQRSGADLARAAQACRGGVDGAATWSVQARRAGAVTVVTARTSAVPQAPVVGWAFRVDGAGVEHAAVASPAAPTAVGRAAAELLPGR